MRLNASITKRLLLGAACALVLVTVGFAGPATARSTSSRGHTASAVRTSARRPAAHAAHAAIVGGSVVFGSTYPGIAFLLAQTSPTEGVTCTGAVIAPNLVLTAAHCVEDVTTGLRYPSSSMFVSVGNDDIEHPAAGSVYRVSRTVVDPGFLPLRALNDAAVLVLDGTTTATPLPLAAASDIGLYAAGTTATTLGYGRAVASDDSLQPLLRSAQLVVQSAGTCASSLFGAAISFDAISMMCAVDSPDFTSATCKGDSGGPLIAHRNDGTAVEIGITSWGGPNCETTLPSVFTDVQRVTSFTTAWLAIARGLAAPQKPITPITLPKVTIQSPANLATPSPPAAPAVQDGLYHGKSHQRYKFALRVKTHRSKSIISSWKMSYAITCRPRHVRLHFIVAVAAPAYPISISSHRGTGTNTTFRAPDGERYRVTGLFRGQLLTGTLRIRWRSRRHGVCDSGAIRCRARL